MSATISRVVLPGSATAVAVYSAEDFPQFQRQWVASELLQNCFASANPDKIMEHARSSEKLSQVQEMHLRIFPGMPYPKLLRGKHDAVPADELEQQLFFLKEKTFPSSVAISWLVWAIGWPRRRAEHRQLAVDFLRELLCHVLERAGTLSFDVEAVGAAHHRGATSVSVQHPAGTFAADEVWGRSLRARILPKWREFFRAGLLSSDFQRPSLADLIIFACQPIVDASDANNLVRPLAFGLLSQLWEWLERNMSSLSLQQPDMRTGMLKNRARRQLAMVEATTDAAMFYFRENALWQQHRSVKFVGLVRPT